MSVKPLVSIIIPTYNRAHLVRETLDSIIDQTYENWECIVVDDGSTDNTSEILKEYCIKDKRFQYLNRPENHPKGANVCRNYGLRQSKGKYIQWLDSDDLLSPNKLELQISRSLFEKTEIVTCKWGNFNNIDKYELKDLYIYKDYSNGLDLLHDYGKYSTYFPLHAFLIKTSVLNRTVFWNETLKINQDGEYLARILANTKGVSFEENAHVLYRKSDLDNISVYTEENIGDLVRSWKMIESFLKPYNQKQSKVYISSAKARIYGYLKNDYPWFVVKHFLFFKANIFLSIKYKFKRVLNKFTI